MPTDARNPDSDQIKAAPGNAILKLWHNLRHDRGDSRMAAISIVGTGAIMSALFVLCLIFAPKHPLMLLCLIFAIGFIMFCSISKSDTFLSSRQSDDRINELKKLDRLMLWMTFLCTSLAALIIGL